MISNAKYSVVLIITLITNLSNLLAANYPDQHYVWYIDSMYQHIESSSNVRLSDDGSCMQLADDQIYGYFVMKPAISGQSFNRGLPSWNGNAQDDNCGFLVQMRFPYNDGWSPWLTVGYWKAYIWNSYGETGYAGGVVEVAGLRMA
jgi:hypothetical protein